MEVICTIPHRRDIKVEARKHFLHEVCVSTAFPQMCKFSLDTKPSSLNLWLEQ